MENFGSCEWKFFVYTFLNQDRQMYFLTHNIAEIIIFLVLSSNSIDIRLIHL